jgi:hypothetical protein
MAALAAAAAWRRAVLTLALLAASGALAARVAVRDAPRIRSIEVNLANTGLADAPVRGRIIGPFNSVRSTTVPWNFRHLMGEQINGAPEPLVYRPIYKFVPSQGLPPPKPLDMFKSAPQ